MYKKVSKIFVQNKKLLYICNRKSKGAFKIGEVPEW